MSRRAVIVLAAGALVLVAIGAVVWWLSARGPDAPSTADRFVEALAEGDYEQIDALLDPSIDDAERTVLRDALAGASQTITASALVAATSEDADLQRYETTTTLGGESATLSVVVRQADGRWVVDDESLAVVDVETTLGDHVLVGDAVVPVGSARLLPAAYPVRAYPDALLVGATEVTASTAERAAATVDAALGADAAAIAQTSLEEHLTACTVRDSTVPAGCGLRIPWGVEFDAAELFAYRVEAMPTITLNDEPAATFTARGGRYVVTVTGVDRAGSATTATYQDAQWGLRGSWRIDGDRLVLLAW